MLCFFLVFLDFRWAFVRRSKTVATAGRSYGGPSEKFVGDLGVIFRSCPPTSQKLPLYGNHQTQLILGQLLRSLLQNPRNFSEVAPEVRRAVHMAALCLNLGLWALIGVHKGTLAENNALE